MSSAVWEELVATALLGTERRPPARPAQAEGALAQALEGLPWDDAEAALLSAAGVLAGYRAAGWQPPAVEDAPSPAPLDERPLCSPGAASILEQLADTGQWLLLGEWLRLAGEAGLRPPPELLPALLGAGADVTRLRAALLAVGGARLRWLAAQNPRWSWAAGAVHDAGVDERWRTGSRDDRLALLHAVRAEDPARGRELLASTWDADGAQERAQLMIALQTGLQAADEPFLEAALDDRSGRVRHQAAQLLAALPGSALAARMAQRLRPLVDTGGRLRRKLQVQTPPEPDEAARRDGIDDGGRPQELGAGAWRLAQIVAAAPLSLWREMTGEDAAGTIALAGGADHEPALMLGWSMAARTQRDVDWSAVLARATGDPALLGALAPGAGDDVALVLLEQATDRPALDALLERIPAPWSLRLSRAVIDHVARALTGPQGDAIILRLQNAKLGLDTGVADHAAAALAPVLQREELHPTARLRIADLLTTLDLRRTMTRELTQP